MFTKSLKSVESAIGLVTWRRAVQRIQNMTCSGQRGGTGETFWDIKPPVVQWPESCDPRSQGEI